MKKLHFAFQKIDSLDAKEVASAVLSRLPDVQELGASELQVSIPHLYGSKIMATHF